MPSAYLPLHYPRRVVTPHSPKPTPFLLFPLFIAPFLALSLITADLRANIHSSVPSLLHFRSRTFTAVAKSLFDPDDINNPTKVHAPENGFPPPSLPPTHPNFHLLNTIRTSCRITPRWPSHPRMQAAALRSYGPAYSSIIISHKLKVIYIPVFKVGTTSMMWNIAYLENNRHVLSKASDKSGALDSVLHEMGSRAWQNHTMYKRSADDIRQIFEDPSYLKFGFVRNPFSGIISAYVDKIASFPIESEEYQKQMLSLYGHDLTKRSKANISKPSFGEFLHGVVEVLRLPRTRSNDLRDREAYEDNTSRRDMHWRPQVELLHPDLIHLDFVGRFEKIEHDREVVLEWMYRNTDRRMPIESKGKLHATDPKVKLKLYEMLRHNETLRQLVVDTFRQDFETFHFSKHVPNDR